MQREYFQNAVVGLSIVAMVAAVGHRLDAQETRKETRRILIKADGDGGEARAVQITAGEGEGDDAADETTDRIVATLHAGPYWIGAECVEASDALRSQLSLDKGRGLVVLDVVADSPAAKAGLKKHDVIVTVGEQPVGQASELVKAVDKAKESEVKLGILRAGKSESIAVKPEKRKATGNRFFLFDRAPLDVRMLRPGMVLPKGAEFHIKIEPFRADLPEDMTVTITKQGKETAKIAVKQGDKSWETTADKLGELPDDVRKQIAPMMMALPFPHSDRDVITFVPDTAGNAIWRAREAVEKQRHVAAEAVEKTAKDAAEKVRHEALEKAHRFLEEGRRMGVEQIDERLEALSRQIDALRKSVEQLKSDSKKD
jgi:membrane-associated protease RseP (regulator of RpoE activity)